MLYKTTDKGASWNKIFTETNSRDPLKFLNSVFFIDTNIGWAFGIKKLLKTTDSGANWISLSNSISNSIIYNLKFITPLIGYAVVDHSNDIYKSIDGGLSWNLISTNQGIDSFIFILNENNIWYTRKSEPQFIYYTSNDFQTIAKKNHPLTMVEIKPPRLLCWCLEI